jgi:glycosyltransferase involved in cell wall biosynthesis
VNEPVTVVVPTRDRPALLAEALEAIRAQDYAGVIRTLVVNDGRATIPEFDASPERPVDFHQLATGGGPARARNYGFVRAATEYVAFCDDDDVWESDKLRSQVEALRAAPHAVVCVTAATFATPGRAVVRKLGRGALTTEDLLRSRQTAAHTSSFVVRKNAFAQSLLFDQDLPHSYGEDWDLLLRASRIAPILVVDRPLVRVRLHAGSYYARNWLAMSSALRVLLKRHPELTADRVGAARVYAQIAFAEAALGRPDEAASWLGKARELRPLGARTLLVTAAVRGWVAPETVARMLARFGRGI